MKTPKMVEGSNPGIGARSAPVPGEEGLGRGSQAAGLGSLGRGPSLSRMAWRNLWRNRRRTVLTLISIGFGGFLAVMFTALQDRSFSDMVDVAARLGGGHVSLQHPEYLERPALKRTVDHGDELRGLAAADREVLRAVSRITGPTMLSTTNGSYGAFFVAIDPEVEDESTFSLLEGLVAGEMFSTSEDRGVLLGERLARNLDVELGKKVVYTLTAKNGEIAAGMARLRGIVSTGAPSVDATLCLLPLDAMRQTLGYRPEESTQVALFLADNRASDGVARRIAPALDQDTAVVTWDQAQPELSSFIAMKVGGARFMEGVIMLLVAAGIFNTLFVSVMERLRELGVLMAIGFSPRQLFTLVMWESLWLGLLGIVAGALLTAGPYWYLSEHGIDLSFYLGADSTEVAGVGMSPILRVGIFPEHLFMIILVVLLATLTAGLYPAWRAGRVAPVEAISLV